MKIETSGFYVIDSLEERLDISDDIHVCIFDDGKNIQDIFLGKNAVVHYFLLHFGDVRQIKKSFHQDKQSSQLMVRSFVYAQNKTFSLDIVGLLESDQTTLDMHLVSIVGDNGDIGVNGVVHIGAGIKKVEGYLKQNNIFIGSTGKVRGVPTLIVHSNDVKASHGCNIEKISDDQLFYLRSRGIDKQVAKKMMLESYVRNAFLYLEHVDTHFYNNLVEKINSLI